MLRLTITAYLVCSVLPPCALAQQGGTVPNRYAGAVRQAREMLRAFMAEQEIPGLSAAVGVDGRIVWSEGMGFANLEHRIPVTTLTRFRSGSIAKPMSAAALAVLREQGRIDLDAPVRQYVSRWPSHHHDITLRQLAGHLSGIRHYPPDGDEFFNAKRYTNILDALEIFENDPLLFEPGARYSYSTYGYNLLGAAIQEAAGKPFLVVMQELVFEPLGMRSTVGDHSDTLIAHRTSFYERSGGGNSYHTRRSGWNSQRRVVLNAPFSDNSNKWPGGGFLTTPEDLVRFGFAHIQPGYLRAETLEAMATPMRTASGEATGYGIGWRPGRDERGYRTIGHGGGSVGGTSRLLAYPEHSVVIAIQVNLTDAQYGDLPSRVAWLFIDAQREVER